MDKVAIGTVWHAR